MSDRARRDDALETFGVLIITHGVAFLAGAAAGALVFYLF